MPLRRLSAAEAFGNLKSNPYGDWPRADDPDNRFAAFADPSFRPGFLLEPGQKIFTIGSCFARNIEIALAQRGFEIPMLEFTIDKEEWGGDPLAVLNTYVPAVIAPQIRWAFGLEPFDLSRHGAEVRPGKFVDLQLTSGFRPMPAELVMARRERINAVYRNLADSHVVLITLGLVEAWFDNRSGSYINAAPPKSVAGADPARFELHVMDHDDVVASLHDLIALLGQVCPADVRLIFTVSPVPLNPTFTDKDVAVANTYSKSLLRVAAEAVVSRYDHIEYFPSYESVILSERALAFTDDQIHVSPAIVRFNVDRMIRRYVRSAEEAPSETVARALAERRAGRPGVALKALQTAWAAAPDDGDLTVALAEALILNRNGAAAEKMLLKHLETHDNPKVDLLLARYYNDAGEYQKAAEFAEKTGERSVMVLGASLQRIIAYYHLGRYDEGLAILEKVRYAHERGPLVIFWKARFNEKLGRVSEAEDLYRQCNGLAENLDYMLAFARFLSAQARWTEANAWVDRAIIFSPTNTDALKMRRAYRRKVPVSDKEGDGAGLGERLLGALRGPAEKRAVEVLDAATIGEAGHSRL
jgi:tetratricopeptide (TPR) repeat protein